MIFIDFFFLKNNLCIDEVEKLIIEVGQLHD